MQIFIKPVNASHPQQIECDGFHERAEGLEIYNDGDTVGYIPHEKVAYILPDDSIEEE